MTFDHPTSGKRGEALLLLGLILAALALRLAYLPTELSVTPDGTYYLSIGRALIGGNLEAGLSDYWPPLYPLLIGLASLVVHPLELAGRIVSVIAGTLLLLPLYALARSTFGSRTAWIAAGIAAVHPALIVDSVKVLSEATYTFLFLCALWLGSNAVFRHRRRYAALTGLALAACYLVRPESFLFGPLFVLLILGFGFWERRPAKEAAWLAGIFAVVFLAASLPYIGYLKHETGEWTISGKLATNFFFRPNPRSLIDGKITYQDLSVGGKPRPRFETPAEQPDEGGAPVARGLSQRLMKIVRNVTSQLETSIPAVVSPPFLVLFGLGLARRDRSPGQGRREWLLIAFGCSTLAGYALTIPLARYLTPLVPLALCWIAAGVLVLERQWVDSRLAQRSPVGLRGRLIVPGILLALLAVMFPALSKPFRTPGHGQPVELRLAGEWIRDNGRPDPLILADYPVVGFYAGGTHYYLPDAPVDELLEYTRRREADYLVLTLPQRRKAGISDPNELLAAEPERLRLVYESHEIPGVEVFVIEVVGGEG